MIAAHPVTIEQPGRPQMTLTVPAGWHARENPHTLVLTRDGRRVVIRQCPLERAERDMTGKRAARRFGANVPVRGGGCLYVAGRALNLRPRLGPGGAAPKSDATAEALARAARRRTLAEPRAQGTASAVIKSVRIEASWDWDLPARYFHQVLRFGAITAEVVRRPDGDHLREDPPTCWGGTSSAQQDDALEPRLELQEWNAPPSTETAWRVAYAPPEPLPDGTRLRWTGFVADGEAVVGTDGRLRSVRIDDHGQARGRTTWSAVQVDFTGFPATITPVQPEPRCPSSPSPSS